MSRPSLPLSHPLQTDVHHFLQHFRGCLWHGSCFQQGHQVVHFPGPVAIPEPSSHSFSRTICIVIFFPETQPSLVPGSQKPGFFLHLIGLSSFVSSLASESWSVPRIYAWTSFLLSPCTHGCYTQPCSINCHRAHGMAQWTKALAAESDSLMPGGHIVEGENCLCRLSSDLHTCDMYFLINKQMSVKTYTIHM